METEIGVGAWAYEQEKHCLEPQPVKGGKARDKDPLRMWNPRQEGHPGTEASPVTKAISPPLPAVPLAVGEN